MTSLNKISEPEIDQDSAQYWAACAERKLLHGQCRGCGKAFWYPRSFCPLCASPAVDLVESSGVGVIYSLAIMRKADPPFILAYVTLDEGPTMLSNIVDCAVDAVRIGDPVEVVFVQTEKGSLVPMFRPAAP
jgi:uncharacterized protein